MQQLRTPDELAKSLAQIVERADAGLESLRAGRSTNGHTALKKIADLGKDALRHHAEDRQAAADDDELQAELGDLRARQAAA